MRRGVARNDGARLNRPPVIPGRVEDANPESRDSGFDGGACHRAGQRPDPLASPPNDGVSQTSWSVGVPGSGVVDGYMCRQIPSRADLASSSAASNSAAASGAARAPPLLKIT
jgi:hypothetical protein